MMGLLPLMSWCWESLSVFLETRSPPEYSQCHLISVHFCFIYKVFLPFSFIFSFWLKVYSQEGGQCFIPCPRTKFIVICWTPISNTVASKGFHLCTLKEFSESHFPRQIIYFAVIPFCTVSQHKGIPHIRNTVFFRALPKLPPSPPSPSFGQLVHLFRPSKVNMYIVFF